MIADIRATIDRVLARHDGLCLDTAEDREALADALMAALQPALAIMRCQPVLVDLTVTGARLEAAYSGSMDHRPVILVEE